MKAKTLVDKTKKYAEKAGEIASKINFEKGKAESLRLIGLYHIVTGFVHKK